MTEPCLAVLDVVQLPPEVDVQGMVEASWSAVLQQRLKEENSGGAALSALSMTMSKSMRGVLAVFSFSPATAPEAPIRRGGLCTSGGAANKVDEGDVAGADPLPGRHHELLSKHVGGGSLAALHFKQR